MKTSVSVSAMPVYMVPYMRRTDLEGMNVNK